MQTLGKGAYTAASGRTRLAGGSFAAWARAYFASDARRAITSTLGLLWLLDGLLQFQPFMYSGGFVELVKEGAVAEPLWLEHSINWSVHIFQLDPALFNTLFALIQVLIGIGLLYRRTVKRALILSFAWAIVVWWVGEAFGFMLMEMTAAYPLLGAPGAAPLYALIGAAVWPGRRKGGLLGIGGVKIAWLTLWLLMAWMWLQFQNSAPRAITAQVRLEAPSGMGWLTSIQHWAANGVAGDGIWLALVLAGLSAAIGISVATNWHTKGFLAISIVLNLLYWMIGQGFGGIFTGEGTDPNSGPLFILLAAVLYTLIPHEHRASDARATNDAPGQLERGSPFLMPAGLGRNPSLLRSARGTGKGPTTTFTAASHSPAKPAADVNLPLRTTQGAPRGASAGERHGLPNARP